MRIHEVKSKAISTVGYSRAKSELAVKFKSGKTYIYTGVGKDVWTNMRKTDSIGRFYNRKISGRYVSYEV